MLDELFHRLEQEGRARLDWTVRVPVLDRGLKVPYACRNGVRNLVKPQAFSAQEDPALRTAMRLAIAGDLMSRHADDEQGPRQLIVLPAFDGEPQSADVRRRVVEILREYRVRTVEPDQIPSFADQIAREAHIATCGRGLTGDLYKR